MLGVECRMSGVGCWVSGVGCWVSVSTWCGWRGWRCYTRLLDKAEHVLETDMVCFEANASQYYVDKRQRR
jgi:hypothetical protein